MRGHKICFNGEILKIIPKLYLLLLLIWSPANGMREHKLLKSVPSAQPDLSLPCVPGQLMDPVEAVQQKVKTQISLCGLQTDTTVTVSLFNSLTTKKQTTKFSSANFQKMLSPSYIILRIQSLEGKQCRSR